MGLLRENLILLDANFEDGDKSVHLCLLLFAIC